MSSVRDFSDHFCIPIITIGITRSQFWKGPSWSQTTAHTTSQPANSIRRAIDPVHARSVCECPLRVRYIATEKMFDGMACNICESSRHFVLSTLLCVVGRLWQTEYENVGKNETS